MRFQIEDPKAKKTLMESDDILEVREWLDANANDSWSEDVVTGKLRLVIDGTMTDEEAALFGTASSPNPDGFLAQLVGGPKDGHWVRLRRHRNGIVLATISRTYKVRGGTAWYGWNDKLRRYDFRQVVPN